MKRNLIKKLDILWSKQIRSRDGWCQYHQGDKYSSRLNAHHIIYRSKGNILRWDIVNGISACCIPCHKWGDNSIHSNPERFLKWFRKTCPTKWMYLQKRKNKIVQYKDYHFSLIKESIEGLAPLKDIDHLL